jgi:flagellar protein FliS
MSIAIKAYANTKNLTDVNASNSLELILVVYERIFEHLKVGQIEFSENRYGIEPLSQATDLISIGLQACLDYEKGKEVASNLNQIYTWCISNIFKARATKSVELLQEVIDVLTPIYEGWSELNHSRSRVINNSGQVIKQNYVNQQYAVNF